MALLKLLNLIKQITVEPVQFLASFAMGLSMVVQQVGLYHVVCQQIYESRPEINCYHLANTTVDGAPAENAVQSQVAMWNMAIGMSYLIPALVADIFLGAYGDRYGRKVNMLLGMLGLMISLYAFVVIFTFPLVIPLYILILVNVLTGFTGYVSITMISANAYLADTVLDPELLTIRMSILTVVMSLSMIIGPLIAGATSVLSPAQGMLIAQAFLAAGFLFCMVRIRQIPPAHVRKIQAEKQEKPVEMQHASAEVAQGPQLTQSPPRTQESTWAMVWNLLKETWRTYTRPREGHVRLYLLVAASVFFLNTVSEGCRATIIVLFVQKEPLSWDQDQIGYYRSAQAAMSMVGTTVGIFVFKKLLKLSDTFIIIIGSVSHLAEILVMAFATTTWMVYMSAAISSLSMLVLPCIQSFMAKQVDRDEVGKAFTVFGIAANVGFLVSNAVYNPIYSATLSFFPPMVFLFAAFLQGVALVGILWLHFDSHFKDQADGMKLKEKIVSSLCGTQEHARE